MLNENGKSSVTVNKVELLKKLYKNRDSHFLQYQKDEKRFRAKAIKELQQMTKDAQAGKPVRLMVGLSAPFERTHEYDRVIAMMEMSVAENITISEAQFAQYVLDEWSWKPNFLANSLAYGG